MNLPQIHEPSKVDLPSLCTVCTPEHTPPPEVSRGDKTKARDILAAIRTYEGAIILVTHDEGAVRALEPDRVLLLPDGDEDLWNDDYADLVSLA